MEEKRDCLLYKLLALQKTESACSFSSRHSSRVLSFQWWKIEGSRTQPPGISSIAGASIMELARNLKTECVSRLHPTPSRIVSPDHTVAEAVAIMRQHKTGCLLIYESEKLLGIFTERDLLRRVLGADKPLSTTIASCMTRNPVTLDPNDPINLAIRRMQEGGYRHLPVIDTNGKALGVLSVKHIVHYLAEHFPSTVYNQPPDPNSVPQTPDGA